MFRPKVTPLEETKDWRSERLTSGISNIRRLGASIRAAERGWDWQVNQTEYGPVVEPIPVTIEEASNEARRLLIELMELQAGLA